jgi:hypothetical protein
MDLFDLTGKVALVTGSTKGLGETSAKALAKAGADVAVCGRNPVDLKRVSTEIQAMGRNSAGFELDVLSKEKVKNGIEQVLKHFGRIDILVKMQVQIEFSLEYPGKVGSDHQHQLERIFSGSSGCGSSDDREGIRKSNQYEFHFWKSGSRQSACLCLL